MKTNIPARQITHQFRKISQRLKPGARVRVTPRGQVDGGHEKAGLASREAPDFLAAIKNGPRSTAATEKLVCQIEWGAL